METKDIMAHILPKEFVEYFDLISIEESKGQLVIQLDEKFVPPPEHSDKPLESKGFLPPTHLNDFPIRDKRVILQVRRRKWKDKDTGKTYTRSWDIKAEGTNYTREFAAFLKGFLR